MHCFGGAGEIAVLGQRGEMTELLQIIHERPLCVGDSLECRLVKVMRKPHGSVQKNALESSGCFCQPEDKGIGVTQYR